MAEFFEYDPLTGIKTETSFDEATQQMTLHRSADVEGALDHAKRLSNDRGKDTTAIKNGWMQYAVLPPAIILELKAKGINIFDQNDQARMFAEINQNYPHLRTVTGNEGGKIRVY